MKKEKRAKSQNPLFSDSVWSPDTIFNWLYGLVSLVGFFWVPIWVPIYNSFVNIPFVKIFLVIPLTVLSLIVIIKLCLSKKVDKKSDFNERLNVLNWFSIVILTIYLLIDVVTFINKIHEVSEVRVLVGNISLTLWGLFFISFIGYFIADLIRVDNGWKWKNFFLAAVVFLLMGWLKVEDIAVLIAIILTQTMSAQTYENITYFLEKTNVNSNDYTWINKFKRPNNFERVQDSKLDPWDGEIQLQKIILSLGFIVLYFIVKFIEQFPLIFGYVALTKLNYNIDNLTFLENIVFLVSKGGDKVFGAMYGCLFLLTYKPIHKLVSRVYSIGDDICEKYRFFVWIFCIIIFILPIFRNISINTHFELGVETILEEQEAIEKDEYELEFINRYNYQINNKQIVVKSKDKSYIYYYEDKHLIKIWENNSRLLESKEVTSDD